MAIAENYMGVANAPNPKNNVDNLFPNLVSQYGDKMLDEDEQTYENYVVSLIADAVDYDQSQLSPGRIDNMKYFLGELPSIDVDYDPTTGDYEQDSINRSQAVSTDVMDTVMAILPSLVRIFTSNEHVVDFKPTRGDQADLAQQQTDYINYIFNEENEGFLILHSVFKDLLITKIGIAKWGTEDDPEVKERTFENIPVENIQAMVSDWMQGQPDAKAEVLNQQDIMKGGFDPQTGLVREVKIKFTTSRPRHFVEAVPPEEFRIDRRAKSVKKSLLVGQDQIVTVSELTAKGYDLSMVENFSSGNFGNYYEERLIRTPGIDTAVINNRLVRFGTYFIRVDKDGDGIAELRRVVTIGDDFQIIEDEPVDDVKFAVFSGDPTPHTVVGRSIADLVRDLQEINTQLLRGALDNMSSVMFTDTYVDQNRVNLEDELNDEVGKVVRVNGDPSTAVWERVRQFVGEQIFNMKSAIDDIRQRRTGISEASKGVDPKALQSTNVMGIDAIVSGAQERIELIARIIAETGFKDMFKGLMREVSDHPNIKKTIELRGNWVDIDHSLFDPNMRVMVNPTLARGNDFARLSALSQIKATQEQIMAQFGIANQVVTPQHYMNTVEDMLAIANIKNIDRYFGKITPELMQQIQSAPKEPSPEEVIARAEMEKVKAQTAKAIAQLHQEGTKLALDEDFRRDKLGLDTMVGLIQAFNKDTDKPGDTARSESIVAQGNTRDVKP